MVEWEKPDWMKRVIEEIEKEIAKEQERYQAFLSMMRKTLGLNEIEVGRWIRNRAIGWLEAKGYKLITDIADEMTYFGVEKKPDYFLIIARGGKALDSPLWDKLAHIVHEVVEVNEIKKQLGRVLPSNQYIMPESPPELRRAQKIAHRIAKRIEASFLREYKDIKDRELIRKFPRLQQVE